MQPTNSQPKTEPYQVSPPPQEAISAILSLPLRQLLKKVNLDWKELQEIRLSQARPLTLWYRGRETFLTEDGYETGSPKSAHQVTAQELRETLEFAGAYSLYAYEDEIRQGYLTLPGGHRIGVTGKAVTENGQVKTLRYITSLNIRVAHEVKGCADAVLPWLYSSEGLCHTLLISPPRCGKTTLLRDLIRQISNGRTGFRGMRVGVVDERSEIGGSHLGVPGLDVGVRTDILDGCPKAEGMMMLVRSMSPELIAVDEIGGNADMEAMENAISCGCRILATVHGSSLEEIRQKPLVSGLLQTGIFERFVVLDARHGPGTVRAILDGKGKILCSKSQAPV